MSGRDEGQRLEAVAALLPVLLQALDGLAQAARYLHPPDLEALARAVATLPGPLDGALRPFRDLPWPAPLQDFATRVEHAAALALDACNDFAVSPTADDPLFAAYRALRGQAAAAEVLYPLAASLPPVGRWFLPPGRRGDAALRERLAGAVDPGDRGVLHADNDRATRGGCSLYVPEHLPADEPMPLIVALHRGGGHGRDFLWSWLPDARAQGALLLAPTSTGGTWALQAPEAELARIRSLVERVCLHYPVDPERILLTGLSDGGTFTWVAGLVAATSPFTHLAPMAASFHPGLLTGVAAERLRDRSVYLVHGALDWMFPVAVARTARDALRAAGGSPTYRELADLSHAFPRETCGQVLDWLSAPRPRSR